MINDIKQLKEGAVLSENSHYIVQSFNSETAIVKHFESMENTVIGLSYLQKFTNSADLYSKVVKVTREDKKDGTLGIRSVWENIHSGQVFTVCFKKQDKPKSQKRLNAEIATLINDFSNQIDTIQKNKKGVADAAKRFAEELIKNPVLPYEEGEERVLRGYKIQFDSRDGRYDCVDMDIEQTEKESGVRPVNINTTKWLIYDGVKYEVC